jgi:hypothetical protein
VCQRRVLLAKGGTGERRWRDVETLMDHKDRAPQAFLQALARGKAGKRSRGMPCPRPVLLLHVTSRHVPHITALGRLLDLLPEEARVPVDVAVRLGCVINVNSHGITPGSPHSSAVGCGLFPLLAMLNHSCRPSVAFFFEDGRMRVRAMRSLPLTWRGSMHPQPPLHPRHPPSVQSRHGRLLRPPLPQVRTLRALKAGEELTVPYVNMLSRRDRRRRDLQQGKHFYCRCAR